MNDYRRNIPKLYLYKFLLHLHFIDAVLVPFFTDWGGLSFTQTMILQSFFACAIFILEIPTGAVADFFGRKISLICGSLFGIAGALVYSTAPDFRLFLAGETLWAAGFALISGADQAIVYDTLKQAGETGRAKTIFGRFSSCDLAALTVAAPIGSAIAAFWGLRYTMMCIAVPFALSAIVGLTLHEPPRAETSIRSSYWSTIGSGIRYFSRHPVLRILAFDKISVHALAFLIIWTYQPALQRMGIPIVYFGFVTVGLTLVQIAFLNTFTWLEHFFGGPRRYLVWSAVITGMAFITVGLQQYVILSIAMIIVAAGFGMTRDTLFHTYLNRHIDSDSRATVLSTVSMIERLVTAAIYPLVGMLVDRSLTVALVLIGAGIIVFSLVSRVRAEHLEQ